MSLPRAVQQQVEDADALVAQLNGTQPVNPDTGEPIETLNPHLNHNRKMSRQSQKRSQRYPKKRGNRSTTL